MAKRGEKHTCMFPGCINEAINQIGLRLRRPPGPNNVWTYDTGAFLCDDHADVGLAITLDIAPHVDPRKMWTQVSTELGEEIVREADFKAGNLPESAEGTE